MAVGLPSTLADVSAACGRAVVDLANAMNKCSAMNTMLNDANRYNGTTGLIALGASSADATLLVASFADLQNLSLTAHGQRAQAVASDFFFNAKLLMGVNPL
jgi:hypothetical protein